MSIVVAVRVRPVYADGVAAGGSTPSRRSQQRVDPTDVLEDPTVCGALRFVRDSHITFTQEAMEMMEAERLEAAGGAPSATAGRASSAKRSSTPSTRNSQDRARSPVVSRGSSTLRGESPHHAQKRLSVARSSHPLPQSSSKTRFARPVFEFDCCFSSEPDHLVYGSQLDVYDRLGAPLLHRFLQGYNCCLMAYGQTGSGKTYSMFGPHADELSEMQRQRAQMSTSALPPRHIHGVNAKSSLVRRLQHDEDRGIIFRLCEEFFAEVKQHKETERRASLSALRSPSLAQDAAAAMVNFDVEVTYYQVYREKVYCLLTGSHQSNFAFDANCQSSSAVKSLRVRESAKNGPYVEGLKSLHVHELEDVVALLDTGNRNRRVAATSQNIHSSRSHAVLSLRLRCIRHSEDASFTSVLNLVDLAGSERAGKSEPSSAYASTFSSSRGTPSAARLSETSDINRSLSTLGKVIHVLASRASAAPRSISPPPSAMSSARDTARSHQTTSSSPNVAASPHVPYRESVLTFLLRDSLGGNSSTTILSTVSPMLADAAETLSTLRYASKARHIVNTPVVNTDAKSAMLVAVLRDEVQHLRSQLQVSLSSSHQRDLEHQMEVKQQQLDEYESEVMEMNKERAQWEVEKVAMMERVVLLEHEADTLRGELSAAVETADEYRAKLERLTQMVEGASSTNQQQPSLMASAATSGRSTIAEATQPDATRTASVPVVEEETLTLRDRKGGEVSTASRRGSNASQQQPPLSSKAIVFGSSRSSSPSVPAVQELPPSASSAPPAVVHRNPPPDSPILAPVEHTVGASPGRSFVSGAKPLSTAGSGVWALPEKYQWLLAPSRSTSRQSSMPEDGDVEHQQATLVEEQIELRGLRGASRAATGDNAVVERPMKFTPPPPLGTPRGGGVPTPLGRSVLPNYDDSGDDELLALDNDSFMEAARSAGIDVMALLEAKRREKRRERKKKRRSADNHEAVDAAGLQATGAKDVGATLKAPLVVPQPLPTTNGTGEYAQAPLLPPPSFARKGKSPPRLSRPPQPFQVADPSHGAAARHTTPPAMMHSEFQYRDSKRQQENARRRTEQPAVEQRPVVIPPALEKYHQRLRDQTPPNLRSSQR